MNNNVPIRLYEDPARSVSQNPGPYRPSEEAGWDQAIGDDLPLEDTHGGYLLGTILHLDPEIHQDAEGHRYRVVTVRLKD